MRKRIAVVLLTIVAVMAFATPLAMAAPQWKYTEDGKTGIVVYAPKDEQPIYMKDMLVLEFDIAMAGHIVTDVRLVKRYEPEVTAKIFDVLTAVKQEGCDRFSIELDISDVPEGSYTLIFTVMDAEGKEISDGRTVFITAGRWDLFEGKWYYYRDGHVHNCWELIAEKWYHFGSTGAMDTGWQKFSGKWYWFGENGAMRTGWQKISGKWYCFNNNGAMFVNAWIKIENKWFMVDTDGSMLTGWQKDRGKWYYMDPKTGEMLTGWLPLGNKKYYLGPSGEMYIGTHTINGVKFTFDKNGVQI